MRYRVWRRLEQFKFHYLHWPSDTEQRSSQSFVRTLPLFRGVPADQLMAVMEELAITEREVHEGDSVYHPNTPVRSMAIVLSGMVDLHRPTTRGEEGEERDTSVHLQGERLVQTAALEPGAMIGELEFILDYAGAEPSTNPFQATAKTSVSIPSSPCCLVLSCCASPCFPCSSAFPLPGSVSCLVRG